MRIRNSMALTALLVAGGVQAFSFAPFQSIPVDAETSGVAVADVTGDGLNDLVAVTNSYKYSGTQNGRVLVYPGQFDGLLGAQTELIHNAPYGSVALHVVDLDKNGVSDIIVGHSSGIVLFHAQGDGTFTSRAVTLGGSGDSLATLDVDLDGWLDIVALDWSTDGFVLFGDSTQAFAHSQFLDSNAAGWNDMKAGDVNDDGLDDLLVMSGQGMGPNLSVHRQGGTGAMLPPDTYRIGDSELTRGVAVGDFDGDRRNDVVLTRGRNSPTNIWIYRQTELGLDTAPLAVSSYDIPQQVEVADLDGNGLEDIVVLHYGWHRVGVYLQGATGLQPEILFPAPYGASDEDGLALGDVDNDGCIDAVVADRSGPAILASTGCQLPPPPPAADLGATVFRTGSYIEVVVKNVQGNVDATGIVARVELSPSSPSVKLTSLPGTCQAVIAGGWQFQCTLDHRLAVGSQHVFRFGIKAKNASVHVTASVESVVDDPDSTNNSASATFWY